MDIIPIQASSVPCERVFSSGKETMAPQRRHISPKLMESLQMMKYSIWKGRPLNFTQGMRWNDELIEFEFAARMEPIGDAEAYGRSLKDDEVESDAMEDDLDDLEKDLEALEKQLIDDDQSGDGGDNDSAYDSYE
jgi:hAT family C-terminal dimerisation region